MTGLPISTLLGGDFANKVAMFKSISQGSTEEMAAGIQAGKDAGYRRFQLKLSGDVKEDIDRTLACHAKLSKGDIMLCDPNEGLLFLKRIPFCCNLLQLIAAYCNL